MKKLGYDAEVIWENGNMSKNYDFRLNKILSTGCKLVTHPKLLKSTLANVRHVQQHVITEETVQMFDSFVENYINRVYYPAKDFCKNIVGSKYSKFICGSD